MVAAAAILGRVQCHIGFLQQLVRVDTVQRRHGDADRGADVDPVPIDVEWILERTSEALGKPFGVLIAFGPDLENHEFIAAEPRDHVAGLMTVLSREATSLSSLSPIGWPSVSLIVLNRSRSIRWIATWFLRLCIAASMPLMRSRNWFRLA